MPNPNTSDADLILKAEDLTQMRGMAYRDQDLISVPRILFTLLVSMAENNTTFYGQTDRVGPADPMFERATQMLADFTRIKGLSVVDEIEPLEPGSADGFTRRNLSVQGLIY